LEELEKRRDGVISTQVMQEFYVVASKKIGVDPILAKKILQKFENFEVVTIVPRLIYEAIDCSVTAEVSFWDALIIVAAQSAKCDTLWTEDLNPGQVIRDVRIVNPLASPE
jgi:predicted nucleic acid-binding protein